MQGAIDATGAITAQRPNGFHDAFPPRLHVDFAKEQVRLEFGLLFGVPEVEMDRKAMRLGFLRPPGVTSMRIIRPARLHLHRLLGAS